MKKLTQVLIRVAMLLVGSVVTLGAAAQTVTYYHNDISGSPMLATDAAGNVLWKETYRPYGDKITRRAISGTNKIGYHGKPYDDDTGLSYMGARYYNPVLGRFTGIDPKGIDPDNVHSFNRYAYANNNPYKYVDPDGHSPLDVAFLVYDLGKLGMAMYTGAGVAAAVGDVAFSVVGVVSPIPGAGQALKVARAAERGLEGAKAADRALGPVATNASQLAINRAVGRAAEQKAAKDLIAEGNTILGSQVSVRTSEGRRVIDHLIQDASGSIRAVEVKSGGAVRNSSQLAKDSVLATQGQGGVLVGKNAPAALRGQQIVIETIERRY